jgi:hexosaminidase
MSWCYEANRDRDFISALDLHVFRDEARVMGRLAYDLGNASRHTGHEAFNAGTLFYLLTQDADRALPEEVTPENLRETSEYVRSVIEPLDVARMDREDASLIRAEFANAGRMLLHACDRGTAILEGNMGDSGTRESLAAQMRIILGEHRRVWTARNREGGLQDSISVLEERLREYAGS